MMCFVAHLARNASCPLCFEPSYLHEWALILSSCVSWCSSRPDMKFCSKAEQGAVEFFVWFPAILLLQLLKCLVLVALWYQTQNRVVDTLRAVTTFFYHSLCIRHVRELSPICPALSSGDCCFTCTLIFPCSLSLLRRFSLQASNGRW